jgi:hypothetical protein
VLLLTTTVTIFRRRVDQLIGETIRINIYHAFNLVEAY